MLRKAFISAVDYILFGGSIMLKAKAMEHEMSNINNIIRWNVQKIVNNIVYTIQNNYAIIYSKER